MEKKRLGKKEKKSFCSLVEKKNQKRLHKENVVVGLVHSCPSASTANTSCEKNFQNRKYYSELFKIIVELNSKIYSA